MNKKTTFIVGPRGSGKTTLAKSLTKDKRSYWFADMIELENRFAFSKLTEDTEVLVFDCLSNRDIERIKELLQWNFIEVNRKGKEQFTMPMPELIFITNEIEPFMCFFHPDKEFIFTSKQDFLYASAIQYVQKSFCKDDEPLTIPYLLLGDVAEVIKILTGKEVELNVLTNKNH